MDYEPALPVDFLERGTDDLDGQELEELVANIERGVEYQIPSCYMKLFRFHLDHDIHKYRSKNV